MKSKHTSIIPVEKVRLVILMYTCQNSQHNFGCFSSLEQHTPNPPCLDDNFSYTAVRRVIYTGADGARKIIIRVRIILRRSFPSTRTHLHSADDTTHTTSA
jgi:hypothetical protein